MDVNLALGHLLRNDMFEEAEPELQQLAYFRTRISKLFYFSCFFLIYIHTGNESINLG